LEIITKIKYLCKLINIDDIGGYSSISKLRDYDGKNPYIKKLKKKLLKDGKITLTDFQKSYILDNYDKEPMLINKIVNISEYLGEALQKQEELSFKPERILIEYILADSEKTYHVYGKLTRKQEKSIMYFLPKNQVLDDPYFEQIDIDVDFEKYEKLDKFINMDGSIGRKVFDKQKEGVKFLLTRNGAILADQMGSGKGLINSELVITPNGLKRFGDLKIGDKIIGSNGKACTITGVFPQGLKDIYKITFNDGYNITTDGSHLWSVSNKNNKSIVLSVDQMLDKNLVIDGDNVKTYYKDNKWYIPIVKPIHFENDDDLLESPYSIGNSIGIDTFEGKQLPTQYKYISIEKRIEILQGLMDVDGYYRVDKNGKNGSLEYTTISELLVDDVAEIIHSLGGLVKKRVKKLIDGKKIFILSIKLPSDIIPFSDTVKNTQYKATNKSNIIRYIKNIEPCGQAETVCISVDAPDKLYVMKHGIVTHNTYQTIISAIESGSKKVLIVCPTSAKLNWERELHYMQEYDTAVVSGSKYKTAKYTIINFDILKNFHTLKGEEQDGIPPSRDLVNSKFDLCIIDEAHNLRNHKSIRGAIMRELCVDYGIEKTWLLTGTPVANRPMDFYNLLSLIKSPIVKDWKHYVTRYCEGKQITTKTKGGKLKKIWLTDGASNLDELSMKSRNILLRRLTHEFSDMPDKTITPLYFDMDKNQESEYYSLWDTYLEERKKLKKRGKVEKELVELSLLRRFIANETIPKTIELVDEIINEGNKVVIFTCFTDEIKTLSEYYGKNCVTHYGEMNNTEKQKSVDRFQDEGGPMVFIGNIISAGVAITLTRAHYMVFNSFDWVPGNIEQCEFRCYRIGQKNNVKIYYNLFNDTIVTRMWETIKYKQSIIDTILNNSTANETNYIEDAIDYITKNENE
jgi:SWI/SNF-related matrix-associated actin-dependent regulator 1 of chromatin subfamily A